MRKSMKKFAAAALVVAPVSAAMVGGAVVLGGAPVWLAVALTVAFWTVL